jgi:hypothetical protein
LLVVSRVKQSKAHSHEPFTKGGRIAHKKAEPREGTSRECRYADARHKGIKKQEDWSYKSIKFRFAMRPGKSQEPPVTDDGRLQELVEAVKPDIRVNL